MASVKDIKEAMKLLDPKTEAHWDAPGVPSLAAIQMVVPDATADDLVRAGFVAPKAEINTAAKPNPAAATTDEKKVLPEVPDVLPPPKGLSDDMLLAIVTKAREALVDVEADIAAARNERSQVSAKIDLLVGHKDALMRVVEDYSPRVEFSRAVREIQKQTGVQLIARKAQAIELSQRYNMDAKVTPSKLDASRLNHRKSPEEIRNMAAFIHQASARQIHERG